MNTMNSETTNVIFITEHIDVDHDQPLYRKCCLQASHSISDNSTFFYYNKTNLKSESSAISQLAYVRHTLKYNCCP